jgi:hypothetical protein
LLREQGSGRALLLLLLLLLLWHSCTVLSLLLLQLLLQLLLLLLMLQVSTDSASHAAIQSCTLLRSAAETSSMPTRELASLSSLGGSTQSRW